jgi:hypothetical protein
MRIFRPRTVRVEFYKGYTRTCLTSGTKMEFDYEGIAVPGTYAIATTHIGEAKADGTPVAITEAAVCDICGNWATDLCTSGKTTTTNPEDFLNSRISRRTEIIVYACPDHYEEILGSLCDEYGTACNKYYPDELAAAVDRDATRR